MFGEEELLPVADGPHGCVWLRAKSGAYWYVFPWAVAVGLSSDIQIEVARFVERGLGQ